MKNWYKKPVTKGLLLLLAHIMVVTACLSLAVVLNFSSSMDFLNAGKPYEESESFKNLIYNTTWDIMEGISMKNNFESDGKYNPDKIVDVIEYAKTTQISGENEHGLAYELQDLVNWSNEYVEDGGEYEENNVVVCEKPEGSFYYYSMNEFQLLVSDGKLKIEVSDMSTSEYLKDLQNGYYTSGYYGELTIENAKGETEYVDCWTFNEFINEKYAPVGASNILEVVNKTPELNGKLSKVYNSLQNALGSISPQMERYLYSSDTWEEGNTNFTYMLVDENAKKVYTNNGQYKDYSSVKESLEQMKAGDDNQYLIVRPKLAEFETNMDISASEWRSMVKSYTYTKQGDCIFAASVDTKFPIQDAFYSDSQEYNTYAPYLKMAAAGCAASVILFLVILIWMTLIAGRSGKDGEVHLNGFDRWKTEIAAALVILIWIVPIVFVGTSWSFNGMSYSTDVVSKGVYLQNTAQTVYYSSVSNLNTGDMVFAGLASAYTTACFLFGYLSLVRRIKARTVWENSLCRGIIGFIKTFWENRNITFKASAVLAVFILIHWIMSATGGSIIFILLTLAVDGAAAYFIVINAIAKSRIKTGISEIASGNVDYQIQLTHLKGENLKMAKMVNDIGNGLQRAVEEGMKSERLKTDLITNVSHDIKTPLTSIINYVDLLKREKFDDPKIQGYLDILEAKAQRLKTLTEDVVEASKVSSGNITLELMDVNLVEMLNQTIGEFEEKFAAKGLTVVQKLPETPAIIHVDGRRMWRVLENIYNNAAKYAMPNTRVYADLWVSEESVGFSLKNISEQPLNISADELTERFIRGDISRGTEGSGLGLSIAKSLTAMQGGEFQLYLDGDLFKVTIEFPKAK